MIFRKKLLLVFISILVLFTGCSSATEEVSLFKRRIGRVDLIRQKADLYDMDTTIMQLISIEQRTKEYNFSAGTSIAYDANFLTVPAALVYSFGDMGELASIEYFFEFSKDNAEKEINDVYEECIKFFGYPDEGYTRGIYEYLYKNPSVLWIKNNAQISLEFFLDDNLVANAHLKYFKSEWSGTSVSVFKLPFSPHALGDSILTVVGAESKENSFDKNSVVEYIYGPAGEERLIVDYVFLGETLNSVEIKLNADVKNEKQMENLTKNIVAFMDEKFDGAQVKDRTDLDAYDISWSGEATEISLYSDKDSGNRQITVTVEFFEYLH